MAANAAGVLELFEPEDVAFLHDPQTAGLIPHLKASGKTVIWRCHIGTDEQNELSQSGWDFLAPYIDRPTPASSPAAPTCPSAATRCWSRSCRPRSTRSRQRTRRSRESRCAAILRHTGLAPEDRRNGDGAGSAAAAAALGRVERRCEVIGSGPLPELGTPLVVQVSRWDRLKDPVGVMRGFAAAAPGDAART